MKGRHIIWTGIIALVIGVLMIFYHKTLITRDIVIGCGILFILAGAMNLTVFLVGRDSSGKPKHNAASMVVGWIASAAAVVLGLCMVMFQGTFVTLVGYMFAFLIIFAALFQLFLLIFGSRPTKLSGGWYVVPTILVGIAVYLFLQRPQIDDSSIMLASGIAMGLFGLACVIEGAEIGASNRAAIKASRHESEHAEPLAEHTELEAAHVEPEPEEHTAEPVKEPDDEPKA